MTTWPPAVLGTAQLGFDYGVANRRGMPDEVDAVAILCCAAALGVAGFDTARAYGASEQRVGLALRKLGQAAPPVVTKLAPAPESDDAAALQEHAERSLMESFEALGCRRIDTLLLHRAADLGRGDGALWRALQSHAEDGRIGRLGVSVQSPAELERALATPGVAHIQLPFNPLDWRWDEAGAGRRLRERPEVTVDVRSVFLQGLLIGDERTPWPTVGVEPLALLSALRGLVRELGRRSLADLCVAHVRAQPWVGRLVVGVDGLDQLEETLGLFDRPPLDEAACRALRDLTGRVPEMLLDPARWPR